MHNSERQTYMRTRIGLFIMFFFVLALNGRAQEYRGTIFGQVTDQSGAAIAGAKVTAKGPQQTYSAITRRDGDFTIPFVELGLYSVQAEASGFGIQTQDGVHIDVAAKITLNFRLKVGQASETVTVAANSAGLNTADASVGTVMDPEKIQNLPLNGRQVYQLLALTPGVKQNTVGFSGTRGWDETNQIYINGQSGNYNQFTLNGAPVSQQGGGGAGTWNIAPSIDAVDEFKVMTNTYDASYGREAGGTVNTVLKSGTDNFHGTLYDFWRNAVLDANMYQDDQQGLPKPFHNEHQYGGTVGGPVYRKKTFFFFNYEGYNEIRPTSAQTGTFTADMLPGPDGSVNLSNYLAAVNETNIYDPQTTRCAVAGQNPCNQYVRDPFPNNTIPANRLSAIGLNIAKLYPAPNRPGYSSNYVLVDPGKYQYKMPIARVDQVFTDKTRLYAMFAWWSGTEFQNGSGLPGEIAQGNINNYRSSLTQILDLTHTFTQNILSDVRLSFNRAWNVSPDGAAATGAYPGFTAKSLGLNMPAIPTTSLDLPPEINIYNCCTANIIGNTVSPSLFETYDLGPSLIWTLKSHTFHFGAEFMLFHDVPTGIGQPNGQFTFQSSLTQQNPYQGNNDGDAIAELLLGIPENGSIQDFESVYESYNYYAGFVQDDWKLRRNLTVNLGLRWETESSPHDRNDRLTAGFCTTCTNPLTNQIDYAQFPNLPNPLLGGLQFASNKLSAYQNYFGTLLPKVGVSLGLSPRLVMRGGYGLGTALGIELGAQSTWQQTTNYTDSTDGGLTPSPYFNSGTPYPGGFITPPGNTQGLLSGVGSAQSFDRRDRKIPRVQQYSFGFQGEAPLGIIWDLEYVGTHTTRLRAGIQLNSLTPAEWAAGHANPGLLQQNVPNPFYGVLSSATELASSPTIQQQYLLTPYPQFSGPSGGVYDYADPQGYTDYNSMVAKLEKRLSGNGALIKGLSMLTSFTWSKTLSATNRLNNGNAGLVDPNPYKAIDGTDRPWDFAFSGLYGLPIGKGGLIASSAHGLVGELLNDWQLEWIFTNDGGTAVSYPNNYTYTCGNYNIVSQHRTSESYLNNTNPGCFQSFAPYTTVTALPTTESVRNPWAQQTTLGFEKMFKLTEGTKLQFKAEAFNLTNTPIFGLNGGNANQAPQRVTSVSNPNQPGAWDGYGTINSSTLNQPRQIQFGAKILF
ncbi:TonB-dependent receptor [Acidicapsa ligni]|uniref:TonB-dependent receptor n=1 Tax=Acidicapsa ligni TaxID=542300 RepID=UPI0021DFF35E|nr:Plug and carboxypeptidase regulatory-like domain-containing protein [Acidicapsa ligni]